MIVLALLLVIAGFQGDTAVSSTWTGRLTIGAEIYAISGNSRHDPSGAMLFTLDIADASGHSVRSVSGALRTSGGEITVDT